MRRLRDESTQAWKMTTGSDMVILFSGCGFITSSQMITSSAAFIPVPTCNAATHILSTTSSGSG